MMNATSEAVIKLDHDQIGKIVIGAVREMCMTMQDDAPPVWADLRETERRDLLVMIHSLEANPDDTAEAYHQRNVAKLTETGWSFGPFYDPSRKLHPKCVGYARMSVKYRAKEELKVRMIKHLLQPMGGKV